MALPAPLHLLASADARRRGWLILLVGAWGTQAIVTQSLLLREALVLLFGSELVWGIVLAAWLLGVAGGGLLGARWVASDRGRWGVDVRLAVLMLLLTLAGILAVAALRTGRAWLGVAPGELLSPAHIFLLAAACVMPVGLLVGMAYPLACCVGPGRATAPPARGYLAFGHIYALESLGSLIGGAAFSFWMVDHLPPLQALLACGVLTGAAGAGLAAPSSRTSRALAGGLGGAAVLALLASLLWAGAADGWLRELRWRSLAPGYERLVELESRYQNLAVGRRAEQYSLYCNGQVAVDFPDPYTYVPLAHFWLCQHPVPRRVLVLGGGAEGLLAEILLHPVDEVHYVEPDPRQVELLRPFLAPDDRRALADRRVHVHAQDARHFVKTRRGEFDLVIARLPEPTSALRARFYTTRFWAELRRAMTPRAVVCTTVTAAPAELSSLGRAYLAGVRATLATQFPSVVVGWGDPAQLLAATHEGLLTTDPLVLAERYTQRGVASAHFDAAWFDGATDWLEPAKLARRAADLAADQNPELSTDLRPIVYLQRLELWEAQHARGAAAARHAGGSGEECRGGWMMRLRGIGLGQLVVALAVLAAGPLLVSVLRHGGRRGVTTGAIIVSVASTGLATMALSIVWLFAFQNLYGYVYQRIGWIIALFMGGLVLGCGLAERRPQEPVPADGASLATHVWPRQTGRLLVVVDVLLAALACAVPLFLPALGALQSTPRALVVVEWTISSLVVVSGALGGAGFTLAARTQLALTGRAGGVAGTIVGADHAGACVGALLCGLLLVPVFGTATTGVLLGATKLVSAGLLLLGARTTGRS